ncbi:MAG TPA: hypothetical protein ENK85_05555 [Saprospiraceae bacterium]|nr:hypothetical protein [Saprospiraceae bacterium]
MNASFETKMNSLLSEGYEFRFGDYISKGWSLLTANAGSFIIYSLIAAVTVFVVNLIPILGQLASSLVVSPALLAGFYYMAREADVEGHTELGTGFRAFNDLGKLIPVWLLTFLITILSAAPFLLLGGYRIITWYMAIQADPTAMMDGGIPDLGLSYILLIIPLYFSIAYALAVPLVIFKDMNAWEAMETSRKIVTKKWFLFFLLQFVSGFIAGIGVLLLFIGIFFTYSMVVLPMYAAYKDIIGFDSETDEDELDHLIA